MYKLTFRVLPIEGKDSTIELVTKVLKQEVAYEQLLIAKAFEGNLYHEAFFETPFFSDLAHAFYYLESVQDKIPGYSINLHSVKYHQPLVQHQYPFQESKEEVVLSVNTKRDTYKHLDWQGFVYYYEQGEFYVPVDKAIGTLWFDVSLRGEAPLDKTKVADVEHLIDVLDQRCIQ